MVEDLLTSFSLFAKYLDVKIINASFAISDGWKPKEPIPNHDREPLRTFPIPGIKTNISNINDTIIAKTIIHNDKNNFVLTDLNIPILRELVSQEDVLLSEIKDSQVQLVDL